MAEAKRLRDLDEKNARLRQLLAPVELDKAILRGVASKKWLRRQGVSALSATCGRGITSASAARAGCPLAAKRSGIIRSDLRATPMSSTG